MNLTKSILSRAAVLASLALLTPAIYASPLITDVVETGGDNEATDTVRAKWTGVTFSNGIAGEFANPYTVGLFGEDVPAYVDRTHQWNGATADLPLPSYLVGGEYIMIGNDNRDNANLRLDVTVSEPALVYILVDNRLTDGASGDPPEYGNPLEAWTGMAWMATNGFAPVLNGLNRFDDPAFPSVPDEVGVDEAADGDIDQFASVYFKQVEAGTFSLYQADNSGRNMYGVVVKRPSGSLNNPPEVANVVPANNSLFYPAANGISFTATTLAPNNLEPANIKLSLNGVDVSAKLAVSGTTTSRSVAYTALEPNTIYKARISVSDQAARTTTVDLLFDTFNASTAVVIEAEDYDYDGGQFLPTPLPGGYAGLAGTAEVDYHDNNVATTAVEYRWSDYVGLAVATDSQRPVFVNAGATDYQVSQFQAGDWMNYTRAFPEGKYVVYLRASSSVPQGVRLYKIGANQAAIALGTFAVGSVAATTPFAYVPLTDPAGNSLVLTLSGVTTLRLAALAAPIQNIQANFLVAAPTAAAAGPPYVSAVSPADGAVDVPLDAVVKATIANGGTQVAPGSVTLSFNGSDVSSAASIITSADGVQVTYDPPGSLALNTTCTVSVACLDTAGASVAKEWSFQTLPFKPIVTSVVETDGDDSFDTPAQYTGQTISHPNLGTITVGTFREDVPAFRDRVHQWNGIAAALPLPSYLVGGEYIMIRNDNRDNWPFQVDVTVSEPALAYVLVDNRLYDGAGANPPDFSAGNMAWLLDNGWAPVVTGYNRIGTSNLPDEIAVDEGGDGVGPGAGLNNYSSVYVKEVPAGTFSLYSADNAGNNMYGVVVQAVAAHRFVPTVSITSPANDTAYPTAPVDITITAEAAVRDSSITKVEFFAGVANKIGEAASAPYSVVWSGVTPGRYALRAKATAANGQSVMSAPVGVIVGKVISINFQATTADVPPGYLPDYGDVFGDRLNGYSYGWDADNTAYARDRNNVRSPDERYDTFNHMQKDLPAGRVWEIEVPNGRYYVQAVVGESDNQNSVYDLQAEGVTIVAGAGGGTVWWLEGAGVVTVSDGRLSLGNGPTASNNKVTFVDIAELPAEVVKPVFNPLSLSGSTLTISWTGGGKLQEADEVAGPWSDVTGNPQTPYAVQATALRKFYRVLVP